MIKWIGYSDVEVVLHRYSRFLGDVIEIVHDEA